MDTPLLVEILHAKPDDWITHWIDAINEDEIYLSTVTISEINYCIDKIDDGKQKERLCTWMKKELLPRFNGKIIPIDEEVFKEWKALVSELKAVNKPLSAFDGLIAATVRAKRLVLITYNRETFSATGIEVSDPWQG